MAEFIRGKTANEVWKKAVDCIFEKNILQTGRTGEVLEVLHVFTEIENPQQKWISDRIPPMSIGFAFAELVWIINGENRADIINYWNPKLNKYAGDGEFYHGAYGKRIRSHFEFDQLEYAYLALKNTSDSRQVVIQISDCRVDFPKEQGKPANEDIPCNICSLLKLRNGKLEWTQIMRSNDVLLGMPYNFIQFTSIQEIMAGWLEVEVGTYNHYSDSLHLYQNQVSKIGSVKNSYIVNCDSLSIGKKESEELFGEIYSRMKTIALDNPSEAEVVLLSQLNCKYNAYNNIMFIIAAYALYKMGNETCSNNVVNQCSNRLYIEMWNSWVSAKKKEKRD